MTPDRDAMDALAAEYVLGTLAGPARERFAAIAADEPDIASLVSHWERRLDGFNAAVPGLIPPARAWQRVSSATADAAQGVGRARVDRTQDAGPGIWRSLAFWRTLSGTASMALVLLLVAGPGGGLEGLWNRGSVVDGQPPAVASRPAEDAVPAEVPATLLARNAPDISPRASLIIPAPVPIEATRSRERDRRTRSASFSTAETVGLLAQPDAGVDVWIVRYDETRSRLIVRSLGGSGAGASLETSFELWIIAPDSAPESLGVLGGDGSGEVVITQGQADQLAVATLAVSIEPRGGSPTGAPTGPVVRMGQTIEL